MSFINNCGWKGKHFQTKIDKCKQKLEKIKQTIAVNVFHAKKNKKETEQT